MSKHAMTGSHLAILAAAARKPGVTFHEINAAGDWCLKHCTAQALEERGLIFSIRARERRQHACSVGFHPTTAGLALLREIASAGKAVLLAHRKAA
jgi:hypothetical protein